MAQGILIILTLLGIAVISGVMYARARNERYTYAAEEMMTKERLKVIIKREIADEIEKRAPSSMSDDELEQAIRRMAKVRSALKQCVDGIPQAREMVKELIAVIIKRHLPDVDSVCKVVDFRGNYLTDEEKFEVLMYYYKNVKGYGADALAQLIHKYEWDSEKAIIEDKTQNSYAVTSDDLNDAYEMEDIHLDYDQMVDVLATLMYQPYKGYGVVDTLNEMNINGFNIGTSGYIMEHLTNVSRNKEQRATRSVWLFFEGKQIHLRFLTFTSQEEIMRVIKLMIRYNRPGPLTEKRGYLVNTMANKSRIAAAIPPMAEYPVCFVRKFTLTNNTVYTWIFRPYTKLVKSAESEWDGYIRDHYSDMDVEIIDRLINEPKTDLDDLKVKMLSKGRNLPGYVKGGNIVINFLRFLMEGQQTAIITGRQGSGKTTFLQTLIRFVDPRLTIRVIEMAFELYLREMYPERNIVSFQETATVTAMEAQDFTKKSDGAVGIVGEIAQDAVAERWLQYTRIASIFTLATHHANRTEDLVTGLRDHIVSAGHIPSPEAVERQVLEGLKFDIHVDVTADGYRYVERITEVVPHIVKPEIVNIDPKNVEYTHAVAERNYYATKLIESTFQVRDIIRYDKEKHEYRLVNLPTDERLRDMLSRMQDNTKREFAEFLAENRPRKVVSA